MDFIKINGNVPSSKNSRIFNYKLKKSFHSKTTQKFVKSSESEFIEQKEKFLSLIKNKSKPFKIGLHFIRDSKRKWDFINMCQIIFDLMVKNNWIDDDNTNEIVPFPVEIDNEYYTVDKNLAGVLITIL